MKLPRVRHRLDQTYSVLPMTDQVHPYWGQVKDRYDDTYLYDIKIARQQAIFSPCVSTALHENVAETVDKLSALGQGSAKMDWDNNPNFITLSMLNSVVQHMSFPCSLAALQSPPAIHGCIVLMQSITRFGRPSPFSYEYGYLCRYNSFIKETRQPHNYLLQEGHIPILSRTVSELIEDGLSETYQVYGKFSNSTCPWTDNYTGPLITDNHVLRLAQLLDIDRKHFLIFLRSNYALRLSAVLYTMCQSVFSPNKDPSREDPLIQIYGRIYPRALLLVPNYPFGENSLHYDTMDLDGRHKPTTKFLDAEDSKLVFRAYADRLMVLSGTALHSRASTSLALDLLQCIQPIIHDGCEDELPRAIRATVRCMWGDLVAGELALKSLVRHSMRLLHAIKHWFDFLIERVKSAYEKLVEAMDSIIEEELVNFVIRMILEAGPKNEEAPDSALAAPLIPAVTEIFFTLKKVFPSAYLKRRFGQSIFSWVAFLVNFQNTVAPAAHPSRLRWVTCLNFLSQIVGILGGNKCVVYCSPKCYARAGNLPRAHTSATNTTHVE
ncbi:hypothetical protein RSOLAG22IIIB_11580 [Rhizoctonia solani]|uniref:Uncharacterized protein n=1 Tax=Rhizoctonia solani TaxID=456999 RepID=A0A0K6GA14_9AGAM|nr:hypothetical protein RSOLAG22IIIB_11580 [Rhizoctonia solani]